MHDVGRRRHESTHFEPGDEHLLGYDFDDPHARYAAPWWPEQGHLMTQRDQGLTQPHHNALGATVFRDGEPHVVELDDVHVRPASAGAWRPTLRRRWVA